MIISLIVFFLSGAFLCNSVPHFVAGVQGRPFPTPFAKPSGIGNSSPVVNFLWGFLNLVAGVLLFARQPLTNYFYPNLSGLFAGIFLMGLFSAFHFGKGQRGEPK